MSNEGKVGLNGGLDRNGSHRSARTESRNVLARSMCSRPAGLARKHAKMIGLLLVVGVAIVVISAMSLAPAQKSAQQNPAQINKQPPGSPYPVAGYCYDTDGVTKLPGCSVVVTDVTKGTSSPVLTSSGTGYYSTSLGDWTAWDLGDEILVHAELGIKYGENTGIVAGTGLPLSITLNLEIPEFPVLALPILGIVGLFVAMSVIRRKD